MHSWDDFRYFHSVVSQGSFSQAAKQLGVNHSTVSRRIQSLEQTHGVKLVERTPSGFELTEAGAAVFEIVSELHDKSQQAARVLQGKDRRLEGPIHLTMPHEIFDFLLADSLQEFTARYPSIELTLTVSKGIKNLANREADIAVRLTPSPPEYLLGKCFTPLQHGLYRKAGLETVQNTPIVVWSFEHQVPNWAHEHLANPRIALRVDDLGSMYEAVRRGFGVARMPCFMPDGRRERQVERLPVFQPKSDWGLWLLNHVDLKDSARIVRLKEFLAEVLHEQIPLFAGECSNWVDGYRR